MAVERSSIPKHGPWLTGAYIAGLVFIFVGQRVIGDSGLTRTLLDGIGAAICVGALAVRLVGRSRVPAAAARVETIASALYGLGLLALGLYWLTTSGGLELLGLREAEGGEHLTAIVGPLWGALLVCVLFTLLFIELSYVSMPIAGAVELRRVYMSAASGLTLGLALVYLMGFNYTVTEFEVRRDLSYFKVATPSEATLNMVRRLDAPIDVVLFFPESNEVLERVRPYFDSLAESTSKVRVKVNDHVLAPRLAKEHHVRGNGHVLVLHGDQGESFQVGLKLESARRRLKRLDANFQEDFSAVTQPGRIFYTVVGHGERTNRVRDQAEGLGIENLTTFVRRFGLRHRNLGLAQGLGTEVPDDATVVAVVGPTTDLMPEEVQSLLHYVQGGGRLLLLLEPDTPAGLEPLVDALGLQLERGQLAHEQLYRLLTNTGADRAAILTNRYSSHPSVATVARGTKGVATVFYAAGHLSKKRGDGPQANMIVRSVPGTWADLDGDLEYDSGEEHRMTYSIGAAVVVPNVEAGERATPGDDDSEPQEGRAIVIMDGDVFTDRVFQNRGNWDLATDVMQWLGGGGHAPVGRIESVEDTAIEHSRGQDSLWFGLTVGIVPFLVLAFGLIFTSRRRKRQSGRSS